MLFDMAGVNRRGYRDNRPHSWRLHRSGDDGRAAPRVPDQDVGWRRPVGHELACLDDVVDLDGERPVAPVSLRFTKAQRVEAQQPIPSAASCLQIRAAAGQSLPRVKPWANTPQPRTAV